MEAEISEGMIYHLLNERHEVTPPVAQRIADAAGVQADVLFMEGAQLGGRGDHRG